MKRALPLMVVSVLAVTSATAAAATITGRVLADRDGDGRPSAADTPIAGAVVVFEDQVFATTGPDGRFRMDAFGAGQVWVRAPEGFSPAPVWRTVDGSDVDGVDLVLRPIAPLPRPLRFLHVSDLHIGGVDVGGVRRALEQAIGSGQAPSFVIATGDLSQSSQPEQLGAVAHLATGLSIPFVPGLGNHDWQDGGGTYRAILGPPQYSFDAGGVHFVMLHGNAPVARRLAFLQHDLALVAPGTPTYVFLHYPLTLPFDQQLFDGLVTAGVHHVFTGHYHANRTIEFPGLTDHNVQPLAMGGLELVPAGYETVTVVDGVPHTEPGFIVDRPVTAIATPGPGACVAPGDVPVVVAAALGGGMPAVSASVDGGPAVELTPAGGWDFRGTVAVTAPGPHALVARVTLGHDLRTLTAAFCVGEAAPLEISGTWSQLGGDARHHSATDLEVAPPLATAWTQTVGGFVLGGSPVLDHGRLFVPVAAFGTEARGGVVALDAATGAILWQVRIGSVVSAPVVDLDRVIVATVDGELHAFAAATGAPLWSFDLGGGLPPQARGMYTSPIVANGVVYAGQMYRFAALDALDGTLLWQLAPNPATFVDLTQSTPALDDDRVVGVFGHGADGVHAFDATTGTTLWSHKDDVTRGMSAPPTLDGERAYFAASDGTLFAADAVSGAVGWRAHLAKGGSDYSMWMRGAPALDADHVFATTQTDELVAVGRRDGKIAWHVDGGASYLRAASYRTETHGFSTAPVVTGGTVWLAGDDGVVRAVDAVHGKVTWSLDLGVPVLSSVVPARTTLGDGVLFVASFDGTVRALVRVPDTTPDQTDDGGGGGCAAGGGGRGAGGGGLGLGLVAAALAAARRRRTAR